MAEPAVKSRAPDHPDTLWAVALAAVLLAVALGYLSERGFLFSFVAFLLALLFAGHGGWRVTLVLLRDGPVSERLLLAACVAFLVVGFVMVTLGELDAISPVVVLPAQAAIWAVLLAATRRFRPGVSWDGAASILLLRRGSRIAGATAYLCVTVLGYVAVTGLFSPRYEYDTLTNHLFAPARWLQTGAVDLVPTYFGAPTASYEPMHVELVYAWMMTPFHSDLIARFGQIPFLAVAYLALYAAARRLGLSRDGAAVAPLSVNLVSPVIAQAGGAMVDLALSSCFVATLVFLLRFRDDRAGGSLAASGLYLALFLGTKFAALAFLPILVLVAVYGFWGPAASLVRRLASWGGIGLVLGANWYLRNWAVAGNPLYPLRIDLGDRTLFPGAFGRREISEWVFNLRATEAPWSRLIENLEFALGRGALDELRIGLLLPTAFVVGAVAVALLRMKREPRVRTLVLVGAALTALASYWYVLPSHAVRFMFPALLLWALCPAVLWSGLPRPAITVPSLLAIHVATCFASYLGATPPLYVYPLAALPMLLVWSASALMRVPGRTILAAASTAALLAGFFMANQADGRPRAAREATYEKLGGLGAAWRWVDEHVRGAAVAYTGNNVPYFLLGPRFENPVFYVNTDGNRDWGFHDYDQHHRGRVSPPFTPEPAFFRMVLDEGEWLANLQAAEARYLFVSSLFRNEVVNFRHSKQGFVVEDRWARNQPGIFTLRFANRTARIYEVDPTAPAGPLTPRIEREEIDAIELSRTDPGAAQRLYPGAILVLRQKPDLGAGRQP